MVAAITAAGGVAVVTGEARADRRVLIRARRAAALKRHAKS